MANTGDIEPNTINVPMNNYLYRNQGNSNRWLLLKLEGTASNRSAIGAKVRLQAKVGGRQFWQLREISGGSGYCSQNDLRVHFGLGDANRADVIRIEWPSGQVQELRGSAANQLLNIQEPPVLSVAAPSDDGAFHFTLRGGIGHRYVIQQSTNLVDWSEFTRLTTSDFNTVLVEGDRASASARFYRVLGDN